MADVVMSYVDQMKEYFYCGFKCAQVFVVRLLDRMNCVYFSNSQNTHYFEVAI